MATGDCIGSDIRTRDLLIASQLMVGRNCHNPRGKALGLVPIVDMVDSNSGRDNSAGRFLPHLKVGSR